MSAMDRVGSSVCAAYDVVWERFTARIEGLDDAEYLWEPVVGCWSIRPDDQGRWRIDGADGGTSSDPPPFTTIAWRIGHLAGVALGGFANWLFEDGSLSVHAISFPGRAAEVPQFCQANYRAGRDGIGAIDEAGWFEPLGAKWGPYAQDTTLDLALHVLDEVDHHGAEVGLLRDLYLRRDQLQA
jgi:hypothetical protein